MIWETLRESLEKDNPITSREVLTPAILTVEKFAGVKLTKFAYRVFRREYISTRSKS